MTNNMIFNGSINSVFNTLGIDLSNSMKLVRWDVIKALQPEKVEILCDWFEEIGWFPIISSTPVIDVNSGIVYGSVSLGHECHTSQYTMNYSYVSQSVKENIPYASKLKNPCVNGYKDVWGRNVYGHRFVSVSDASTSLLKALFEIYKERKEEENKKAIGGVTEMATGGITEAATSESVNPTIEKIIEEETMKIEKDDINTHEYFEILEKLQHPEILNDSEGEFEDLIPQLEKAYVKIEQNKIAFSGNVTITRKMMCKIFNANRDDYYTFEEDVVKILKNQ